MPQRIFARFGPLISITMHAFASQADFVQHVIQITPLLEDGQKLRIQRVCGADSPATMDVLQ